MAEYEIESQEEPGALYYHRGSSSVLLLVYWSELDRYALVDLSSGEVARDAQTCSEVVRGMEKLRGRITLSNAE